ncbi:isochorismate synthase [Nocardioides marmoribigeumensis]|uniref:isochorismate synthase n=1 Tax=Nocardioides marmoribigeumensis TaxID=433649 RepID=A0ABU2BST6_9ACTN|nr:isochorismate synthase [Nocardioides marmoribigeumensis]MDR7361692.1 menaquinone-specific isochorismate synthase [Nocardioides marmoribigeumensis]
MTTSPASGAVDAPALVVRTVRVPVPHDLVALLPGDGEQIAWLHRREGFAGWGVAAQIHTRGADRFAEAQEWWQQVTHAAVVRDEVGLPGTGLVCFGSFAFADEPGDSVLTVPQVLVGRRGREAWVTTIHAIAEGSEGSGAVDQHLLPTDPPARPQPVRFSDGARSGTEWQGAVAEAIRRIAAGDLEKVVLARDLLADCGDPLDVRWPLARLAEDYPSCWTFHVDSLFGATPEMLVRRERGLVTSRVLAGTIRRTGDEDHDLRLAASLARSSKDLEEHEYAVRSVAEALEPYSSSMSFPEAPFVLHLPNVMHLATDVAAVMDDDTPSLALAAALHPSAAVGGTPTVDAVALIAELEGMDRGRYAGPVGWMDAAGDGEWAIALRSAQLGEDRRTVRLFAGCGIVADSDPAAELAESQAKLVPVRNALG